MRCPLIYTRACSNFHLYRFCLRDTSIPYAPGHQNLEDDEKFSHDIDESWLYVRYHRDGFSHRSRLIVHSAGVCGIVRITHVKDLKGTSDITCKFEMSLQRTQALTMNPDASTMLRLWTGWELNTGIIVGSAPPCRGLVLKLWDKCMRTPEAGSDHTSNGSEHTSTRGSLSKIRYVFGKLTSTSTGSQQYLGRFSREAKSSDSGHTSDQSIVHGDHEMRTSQKPPRLPEIVITQDRDLYQVP